MRAEAAYRPELNDDRLNTTVEKNRPFSLKRNNGFAMIAGEHAACFLAIDIDLITSDFDAVQPRLTPLYHRLIVAALHPAVNVMMARPACPYLRCIWWTRYHYLNFLNGSGTS